MNYNYAKELKDKGFPQNQDGPLLVDKEKLDPPTGSREDYNPNDYTAYAPTLTELIEACTLDDQDEFELSKAWYKPALSSDKPYIKWEARIHDYETPIFAQGDTPTEVVALLWLTIQERKSRLALQDSTPKGE